MQATAASSTKKRKKSLPQQCSDGTVTFKKKTSYSLPNDIIFEILSWVPAKRLSLRLRWTCKYWFDLITKDPDFAKLHVHHSTSTTNFRSPSILISNPPIEETKRLNRTSCKLVQCSIDSTTGRFSPRVRTSFISKICVDFRILGSCHGLLFFNYNSTDDMGYFIWNPCTKEYRKLPDPDPDVLSARLTFGFGYDSSIDDYKVMINETFFPRKGVGRCRVTVYTLRTNSWSSSSILPLTSSCCGFSNGVFVNGALYFIYHYSTEYYSNTKILSFDIEKETFKEISIQPMWCLQDGLKAVTLEVFEGSLCLVVSTTYDIDMWMMKKDYTVNNDKESLWTKLVKFRRPAFRGGYRNNLNPLRLKQNGEIMVSDRPELYRLHWHEQVEAVYIDSLVSLHSGAYTVDEQLN